MKVLVVDDEPDIVSILRMGLKKRGCEVLTAGNGVEALEIARRDQPDAITLDVNLPGMSGFEVCRQLKSGPETKDIRILILTARDQDEDIREGREAGADAYMTKPFEIGQVFAKLQGL